jgi:hypothetical protein
MGQALGVHDPEPVPSLDSRKWDRHWASMTQSQSHFREWDRHRASVTQSQSRFPRGQAPRVRVLEKSHFRGSVNCP